MGLCFSMNSISTTTTTASSTPASTTPSLLSQMDRFKGQNFAHWKFRVKLHLQKLKAWEVVDSSLGPSFTNKGKLDEEEQKAVTSWTEKDVIAKETIVMCIADSHLAEVQDFRTAKEMWEALLGRYEKSTTASKTFILRELMNIKMEEGGSVGQHLNKVADLASKLAALQAPLNDNYIVAILLNSLPHLGMNSSPSRKTMTTSTWRVSRTRCSNRSSDTKKPRQTLPSSPSINLHHTIVTPLRGRPASTPTRLQQQQEDMVLLVQSLVPSHRCPVQKEESCHGAQVWQAPGRLQLCPCVHDDPLFIYQHQRVVH